MKGEYMAFRMHYPERLTIGIQATARGTFPYYIDQISGKRNASPSCEAKQAIYRWFAMSKDKFLTSDF